MESRECSWLRDGRHGFINTLLYTCISVSFYIHIYIYFNIGGQIIQTVKYADDLVLIAKEETVLQGMIDKLIEIGSCYGMEMNA